VRGRLPHLVMFLIRHALIGFGLAIAFVAALLFYDVGGLASLAKTSASGKLAVALLTFFTGLTFGSVQMGFAVMLEATTSDD